MNFRNMAGGGSERPSAGNLQPLTRQPSIYSLTFDELQNAHGGLGKDFGSMNMDEFLKNIWTAEESQAMAAAFAAVDGGGGGNVGGSTVPLQRQGSLTLPRTLSQKTVDEVWRNLFRESGGKDGNVNSGSNLQQQQRRQPTLGEITLEEFLVRAGVVREDTQSTTLAKLNDGGFYDELPRPNNSTGFGLGFQQQGRSAGVAGSRGQENYHQIPTSQSCNPAMNVNGVRSSPHQLFPKQANVGYATPMQLVSNPESANHGMSVIAGLSDPAVGNGFVQHSSGGGVQGGGGMRSGIAGLSDPAVSNGFVQSCSGGGIQGGGGMGITGLGGGFTVAMESPANQLSSDGLGKSNGDTSSLSPAPYGFGGGVRGRKTGGALEKVVERRQRRMIKNRESAARSRARKQAYTTELEAEVEKLKEENNELQKKQAQILEMQKNQVLEMINQQCGPKKQCLRRTLTGPW